MDISVVGGNLLLVPFYIWEEEMNFTLQTTLIEQIVEREVSALILQLNHWPGLRQDQYDTLVQEKTDACRSLWQAKSVSELKRQLELMEINDTELLAPAIG